jgi:hypothetical protein
MSTFSQNCFWGSLESSETHSKQYAYLETNSFESPFVYYISSKFLSLEPILLDFFSEKEYEIHCVAVGERVNQKHKFIEVKRNFKIRNKINKVNQYEEFDLTFSFFPSLSYISYNAIQDMISSVHKEVSAELELNSINNVPRYKYISPALFENKKIGFYSFELWTVSRIKRNICKLHVVCGNMIYVINFEETVNNPAFTALKIAWELNQYLKGDPLEKLNDEEKRKLKTLEITLPQNIEFEQGKEYPFDFPRKSKDGIVPVEIHLVVSRGEIQQVIVENTNENVAENPNPSLNPASLTPDVNGQYTVLFGQPEKQTVHCYHINEEGKCLAWGEIEVLVHENVKK